MVDAVDLRSFLRPESLLSELSGDCLEALQRAGVRRNVKKGRTIFQKGDDGDSLAIVLEGRIKISAFSASGKESILNILQPGDVLGEIAAIDGGPRTGDAVPIEDAALLQISRRSIMMLIEEDPEFAMSVTRGLCRKLRSASEAIEAGVLDMARRAAAALVRLARQGEDDVVSDAAFSMRIDQSTLAQYAGLARSNMNRSLKKFERQGAVRHEAGVLTILDIDWLEDFANSEDY